MRGSGSFAFLQVSPWFWLSKPQHSLLPSAMGLGKNEDEATLVRESAAYETYKAFNIASPTGSTGRFDGASMVVAHQIFLFSFLEGKPNQFLRSTKLVGDTAYKMASH